VTEFEIIQVSPDTYRLSGELDMATAVSLHEALQHVVAAHGRLVLDIQDLSFIDSSGLRALVQLSERMNGSGPLVLCNVSASVRRLLEIVGFESLPGIEVDNGG
jgi:anti-sigma B factor antagonist